MKEIGEYLRDLRVSHGVSTQEAAEDLNVTSDDIENLEDGVTRAFKDIFILKELVKSYAKYLGVDVNKVMDEFSDYMYEKTSKISLEDIKEIRKEENQTQSEKRISSPYTQIANKKINYKPLIICVISTIVVLVLIYFIFMIATETAPKTKELSIKGVENYEYTDKINSF